MLPISKSRLQYLLLLVFVAILSTGCSLWKDKDTNAPAQSQTGIIDMNKAIKAHPRYGDVVKLEQQYNSLAATAEARSNQELTPIPSDQTGPDMAKLTAGINTALEQEFNAKMEDEQARLNESLKTKAEQLQNSLTEELRAYAEELDSIYQPKIFSVQLKLKTVQLNKDEIDSLQRELENLQNERADKLAVKKEELERRMDQQMAPEKAASEQLLSAYAKQLHEELAQKGNQKAAEIVRRNQPQRPSVTVESQLRHAKLEEQLAVKRNEIEALKQIIVSDVRDKAAKVAAERGIETVLAKVQVNINAIDITGAVISQFSAPSVRLQQ